MPCNIAIFASGGGSNAEQIIRHFKDSSIAEVKLILSNKKDAFVLERAINHNIDSVSFNRSQFYESGYILSLLEGHDIGFIVLAGFLWLIPSSLIQKYPNKIINIHPALLPAYGGKGMYGHHVHQAVFDNNEKVSGISIHYVNEHYDEGSIVLQKKVNLSPSDTPDLIAKKVLELEHLHFPKVIESEIRRLNC